MKSIAELEAEKLRRKVRRMDTVQLYAHNSMYLHMHPDFELCANLCWQELIRRGKELKA